MYEAQNTEIDYASEIPLYAQVKSILRKRILLQHYTDALPGELEISQELRISRGTTRKALGELRAERIIQKRQGKNALIDKAVVRQLTPGIPTFTELLENKGKNPVIQVIESGKAPSPAEVLETFQEPESYIYKRIILDDTDPVALITSYINTAVIEGFHLDSPCCLYKVLKTEYDCIPTFAKDDFFPRLTDSYLSNMLKLAEGTPIFKTRRMAWNKDQNLIEYSLTHCSLDSISITIHSDSDQTNAAFQWPMSLRYQKR